MEADPKDYTYPFIFEMDTTRGRQLIQYKQYIPVVTRLLSESTVNSVISLN